MFLPKKHSKFKVPEREMSLECLNNTQMANVTATVSLERGGEEGSR